MNKSKKAAQRAKLQGELALIEREKNRKAKDFGILLYDQISNDKNKILGVSAGTIFKGDRAFIKEVFERARDDVNSHQVQKDIHQKDLDVLEVKGAHTLPDHTVGQKFNKAGAAVSNAVSIDKRERFYTLF